MKNIINVESFRTHRKLLCTTVVVLKFVRILRSKCNKGIKVDKAIISKDIEEAERLWIVEEQVENSAECKSLEEPLGLYKDEYGVIHYNDCKGLYYRVNYGRQKETPEQLGVLCGYQKLGSLFGK